MALDRLLTEEWVAVEADFQEVYGLDLAACVYGDERGGGPVGARRMLVLAAGLPSRSRTFHAVNDDQWPMSDMLTGLVIERLDTLTAITVRANGGRASRPKPVVPRPRRRKVARRMSTEDMLAGLDSALAGDA